MKVRDYLYPSFLVSENLFAIAQDEEELFRVTEEIVRDGFYRKMELGSVKNAEIRKRFGRMAQELHIEWVQWLTSDINELKLNPATTDGELRKKTISEIIHLAETAAQSGANHIAMISGLDSGEVLREEARKGLGEVLCAVSEALSQYPGMLLFLEPLDRGAHKNNLIGPTPEAVELIGKINKSYNNCRIGWDSAHVALNQENFSVSLHQSVPYLGQLHIANAIIDSKAKGYGDWHMPMGEPGIMTEECAYEILRTAAGIAKKTAPFSVAIETRCLDAGEVRKRVQENQKFLEKILDREA